MECLKHSVNPMGGCIWLNDCNESDELFIVFEEYNDTGLEV